MSLPRLLCAALSSAALLFVGLTVTAEAADLAPLKVANQKSALKVLLQVSGELEHVPYTLDFSEFPAAAPLGEALNAGAVDVGGLGDGPYVFALGAGAPLKVISITHLQGRLTTAILVPKDSPINQVSDLKGKRIVTTKGSIGHLLVIKALHEQGLTGKDVSFTYLMPSESRMVLESGRVDAWSTWDPYTTVATAQGEERVLISGEKLLSNHLYMAATSQAIANKRVQLDDFVARVDRAWQWVNNHPTEYATAMAKVTGLPLDVQLAAARNTHLERVEIDNSVIQGLQKTADLYLSEGILDKPVDVSKGFDPSFNTSARLAQAQ
ncbi:ABC transporter substrate-binding protein [Pseudomonas sp. dw_358]|uniref:ABC transporter substrate-binding protein n=1 Tax=Pseudomonas sp. dw_358 TaxID=2720083 RepID=UPI001BD6BDC0|nr:ABC transporter substrate-binding protein [Pseudomonas sp. dw_358]